MSSALSRKRKSELKDIARNLGVSAEGVREDIVDRIKAHVVKHGTKDSELQELLREGSPRARKLSNLSSANDDDDDTSDSAAPSRPRRASPRKTTTTQSRGTRPAKSGSDSDSAEDPLSEHQVRNFMENMQTDLHEAADLAHSIEHSLQEKFKSGSASIRRASKDLTSTVAHAIDGVVHPRHQHHSHPTDEDDQGWCSKIKSEIKHRFGNCAGACGFSTCMSRNWQRLHDLGSTSTGFVWITCVLEFTVFMCTAHTQHANHHLLHHQDDNCWKSCLAFFTSWNHFLLPFFAYYSALFVMPTLLSQLFNVDRARRVRPDVDEHHHHQHTMTGLLARTTTSGLSYFVFKFALTYLLSQYAADHPVSVVSTHLVDLAKGAAESFANHTGLASAQHHCHHHMLSSSQYVAEVFRYVPASLGLATSGAGAFLALAEAVVSRRK